MENLSLAQEYLLSTLGEKGKYSSMQIEKGICLVAAGILELLMDGISETDGKKIRMVKPLPQEKSYLSSLAGMINQKQPVKLEKVIETYSFQLNDKKINELFLALGDSLEQLGCVKKETGGLFGKSTVYIPLAHKKDMVIQKIRAELLEEGELSDDIIALTALLHKSGDLSRYFSNYEKKALKTRLKNIKDSCENQMVAKMVEYIETLFAMVVIAAT